MVYGVFACVKRCLNDFFYDLGFKIGPGNSWQCQPPRTRGDIPAEMNCHTRVIVVISPSGSGGIALNAASESPNYRKEFIGIYRRLKKNKNEPEPEPHLSVGQDGPGSRHSASIDTLSVMCLRDMFVYPCLGFSILAPSCLASCLSSVCACPAPLSVLRPLLGVCMSHSDLCVSPTLN